ncbi:Hypothetical protein R9X50_00352200 [Acrodontium crateriforme]|uniref:WHIM1 domain-containing protein n=1 Tax=Acrodontium crateriforme TaxID=150365 RepID=A0AAQ3M971_9PEZI|nr:Hypothetical protein R9X50_00352200 [Acrodontium crateriforme]
MPMMDDSDSSSLSSAPEEEVQKLAPIFVKAKRATKQAYPPPVLSPPRPKRTPSPPHEDVLADNPDIAFIVMFRSRFTEAFSTKLSNFGPQDIERGVVDSVPSPQVENLLCALLGLVLNRKKPVERGHHGRALEEAVATNKSQWPHKWGGINPLHGPKDFNTMTPVERLNLLRTLVMWALTSSDAIQTVIKDKYKQVRHPDDENQPLSVQPWGIDGDKRRYFLIQGLDDTGFRVYREGNRYTKNAHWYSVAGDIDEAKALAKKLEDEDTTQAARRLAAKINNAIPMFEATEDKRRRREYRQMQRARFTRPEPGFSMYEGRTRGKRMRYTFDDDEDDFLDDSDATSNRRSARQSARTTPFDSGPEYTNSGRQVKRPRTGEYGESLLSNVVGTDELAPDYEDGTREGYDESDPVRGRSTRSGGRPTRKHVGEYNDIDNLSDEGDAADGWDSDKNDDEDDDDDMPEADADDETGEPGDDDEDEDPQSMVIKLKVSPKALSSYKHADVNGIHKLEFDTENKHVDQPTQTNGHAPPPDARKTTSEPVTCESATVEPVKTEVQNLIPQNGYTTVPAPSTAQSLQSTPPSAPSAYPTPASGSFPDPTLPTTASQHKEPNPI